MGAGACSDFGGAGVSVRRTHNFYGGGGYAHRRNYEIRNPERLKEQALMEQAVARRSRKMSSLSRA